MNYTIVIRICQEESNKSANSLSKATPHNSARSLSQNFCPNSKFRKWRNTVCISHFWNCGSGAKRRLRIADAIVRCCPKETLNKSSAAVSRPFPPTLRYRKRRIHQVFRRFRYLDWPKNLSLTALANLIKASLIKAIWLPFMYYLLGIAIHIINNISRNSA